MTIGTFEVEEIVLSSNNRAWVLVTEPLGPTAQPGAAALAINSLRFEVSRHDAPWWQERLGKHVGIVAQDM